MARRWLRTSCCAVETRQVGDGSHGLSTERSVDYCIGRLSNMERVLFHAAEVFGQNARFFLTETAPVSPPPPVFRARRPAREPPGGLR